MLVQTGALDARQVAKLLADEFGMETVDLGSLRVPGDVLDLVHRSFAVRHRLVPMMREDKKLRIAICDPLDTDGIDSLGHMLKLQIEPFLLDHASCQALFEVL